MHIMHSDQPQDVLIRILAQLIIQRNPNLTASEARDRAIAAVMGALATREQQPQEPSHV